MEDNWPAWAELAWGVRTGGLTFNKSHNGLAQFPYFQAHPEQEDRFSKAMASVNHLGACSCRHITKTRGRNRMGESWRG